MFPDGRDGHDADDMGEGAGAALGVGVEFAAKLGEVDDVVGPGERDGEGGQTPEHERCRNRKEQNNEENRCMYLQTGQQRVHTGRDVRTGERQRKGRGLGLVGSETAKETVVAEAESGRMNSSELERGEEGVDQESECLSGRCSQWETNQASMVGGGSVGGAVGAQASSSTRRKEVERRRPREWQTGAGRRLVEEARVRDFGGESKDGAMKIKQNSPPA
jgi:hypothetical protein